MCSLGPVSHDPHRSIYSHMQDFFPLLYLIFFCIVSVAAIQYWLSNITQGFPSLVRPLCVTLRVPPLYSDTEWTGELWSNHVLLILEN